MPTQTAEQSQSQSTSAEATASTETLNLHDQTIQSGSLPAAQDRNDAHVPTQPSSDQDDSSVKGKQRADAPPPSVTKPPPSTGSESSPKTKQPNLQPADSNDSPTEQKTTVEDNEDYRAISKALDVLRHQLKQALKDVETLENLKRKAMDDPFEFLADLKAKRTRGKIPKLQKIACVPDIDWSKYRFLPENRYAEQSARFSAMAQGIQDHSRHIPAFRTALGYDEPSRMETGSPSPTVARLQQEIAKAHQAIGQISSVSATASDMSDRDSDDEGRASKVHSGVGKGKGVRRTSVTQTGDLPSYQPPPIPPSILESPPKPRDRPLLDTTKGPLTDQEIESATYNQPWTDEEQRRLEELLEIYPDEPVQSQRFQKIAKALGTRTARQVASRVQKYFIKLAKLGLPVPGRVSIPPSRSSTPKKASRKPKARGGSSARGPRPSMRTSGVGYNAMVSGGITNTRISGAHYLTMQGPPSALMSDDEDDNVKETMLKVVQPQAEGEAITGENTIHEGYACDGCGVEPIIGVRYKCTVCDESEEIDLCSKCMALGTFANDHHTPDHPFEAIRVASALPYYADTDYAPTDTLGEYSYLGY